MPHKIVTTHIPGLRFELVTKEVFDWLFKRGGITDIDVQHNVKIEKHQIDIYWRFVRAGVVYQTIVEVRNRKRPAELRDIMAFNDLLSDIPGQPRGIFVTSAGFQRGAREYARKRGIHLLQLTEIADTGRQFEMNTLSFAELKADFNKLAMEVTLFKTSVARLNITFDRKWIDEHASRLAYAQELRFRLNWSEAKLTTLAGADLGALSSRVQEFAQSNRSGGELAIDFVESALIGGVRSEDSECSCPEQIAVKKIEMQIRVEKIVERRPFSSKEFASYLLRDVLAEDEQYVRVKSAAEVSLGSE